VTRVLPTSTIFRMRMDQRLFRDGELLTEAEVQLVCLDRDFEVCEFPEVLLPHGES
jgi:acyl-CoA thioesterase FadM